MRICFIGNSQLRPLVKAWRAGKSGVEATFLAAPGSQLRTLSISDGKLYGSGPLRQTMLETCGRAEAALEEFDAVAVVGLQFGVRRCARLFATHRVWTEAEPTAGEPFLVSHECMVAAARERLRQTVAVSLASELRAVTSASVAIVAQPGMSERVLEDESEAGELWRDLHAGGCEAEVLAVYERACAGLAEGVELVHQPPATAVHRILTRREYDRGQDEIGERPMTSFQLGHMNTAYGHRALRSLLDRLGGPAEGRRSASRA